MDIRGQIIKRTRINARQSGNVFLAVFGAIAMVGALGYTATTIIKGPITTMAGASQRAQAEAEIMSNMRLAVLAVGEMKDVSGNADQDCDFDNIVEPPAFAAGTGPTGGGILPDGLHTVNTVDPWQTNYGYCVWDHGALIDSGGCNGDNRLAGLDTTTYDSGTFAANLRKINKQTVIAIVSAGPDRTFDTTCRDWAAADIDGGADGDLDDAGDLPLLSKGGDDIVLSFNYGEASVATSSKWRIQSDTSDSPTDPTKDTVAEMTDAVELGGGSVQLGDTGTGLLDLSEGGMVLPRETDPAGNSDTGACVSGGLNDQQLRLDVTTTPPTLEICDDNNWQAVSGGGSSSSGSCVDYIPSGFGFDGTDDYLNNLDITPLSNGAQATGSLWFKATSGGIRVMAGTGNASGDGLEVSMQSGGQILVSARNSAGSIIFSNETSASFANDSWHHLLFSMDLSTGDYHVYIDGEDVLNSPTYSASTIAYTDMGDFGIGAAPGGGSPFNGSLSDVWIDFDTYIDFSSAANRELFYSTGYLPKYLGASGEIPSGTAPHIFLAGPADSWNNNKGTLKGFDLNDSYLIPTSPNPGLDCTGEIAVDCSSFGDSFYIDPYTKHCYFLENTGQTWDNAQAACVAEGGYLAAPTSQHENEAIIANLGVAGEVRLGARDDDVEGEWRWETGDLAGNMFWSGNASGSIQNGLYNNWRTTGTPQPNANTDEDCLSAGSYSSRTLWGDFLCTNSVAYVCEFDPEEGTYAYAGSDFIAHWKLDETSGHTVKDSVGSAHGLWVDGANEDLAEETITGQNATALSFNGSTDYVVVAYDPALFSTNAYTVSGWVKGNTATGSTSSPEIVWGRDNRRMAFVWKDYGGGTFGACHDNRGGSFIRTSTNNLDADVWYFVTCTYDGETLSTYIDGVMTGTATGVIEDHPRPFFIGSEHNSLYFDGAVDDVRIYNRALTAGEIAVLYAEALSSGDKVSSYIREDFTSPQTVTQTQNAGETADTYGAVLQRKTDAFGAETGFGVTIKSSPAETDEAIAAVSGVRLGNAGEAGLIFKTKGSDDVMYARSLLDSDGDLGVKINSLSDVYAKLQIGDILSGTWSDSYNHGLLVNASNSLVAIGAADCSGLGDTYYNDSDTGTCYYREATSTANWADAQAACEANGGYLAVISSAEEQDLVWNNLGVSGETTWLGANEIAVLGEWRWQGGELDGVQFWSGTHAVADGGTGVPVSSLYSNWSGYEPNLGSSQACLQWGYFTGVNDGKWDDVECTQLTRYICEIPGSGPVSSGSLSFDTDLIGHYPLDETSGATIDDISPTDNDGTWDDNENNDAGEETTTGVIGNALVFDGDDSIAITGFTKPAAGTIALWVQFDDNTLQRFFGTDGDFEILINGSNQLDADIGESSSHSQTSFTATASTWYHIAITYNSGTGESDIYINGVDQGDSDNAGTAVSGSATLYLGIRGGSTNYLSGKMDDVRIYNRVLNSSEISELYNYTGEVVSVTGTGEAYAALGVTDETIESAYLLYGWQLQIADTDINASTVTQMMTMDALGVTNFTGQFLDSVGDITTSSSSTTAADGGTLELGKAQGTGEAPAVLSDSDTIGAIGFAGQTTSTFSTDANAAMYGKVDGAVSSGSLGADLHFSTDTGGNATGSSDMVIKSDGNIGIGTTSPNSTVHVAGRIETRDGVRIGNDSSCSGASDEGTMRVNTGALQYCDSSAWVNVDGSGATGAMNVLNNITGKVSAVLCWGENSRGECANYTEDLSNNTPVMKVNDNGAVKIVAGLNASCYLTDTGDIYCYGWGERDLLGGSGNTAVPQRIAHPNDLHWTDLDTNESQGCAIDTNQDMYCWGRGDYGQNGDGVKADNSAPNIVSGSHKWKDVAVGNFFACGVTVDGDGYCWGRAAEGRLGNGTATGDLTTPGTISGGIVWKQIDAGEAFACGLDISGNAYCWGRNVEGQLGVGYSSTREETPQTVQGSIVFSSISVGRDVCGVTSDNTLLCWGLLSTSDSGGGTVIVPKRESPTPMGPGISWAKVTNGRGTDCGLDTTGNAYCWGEGDLGQRGDGANNNTESTPQLVSGNYKFKDISSGSNHVSALTHPDLHRVNLAVGWGEDSEYGLGNDSATDDESIPRLAYGRIDWWQYDPGANHGCGITFDQDMYCWGNNGGGQLGINSTTTSQTPALVNGGHKWIYVEADHYITCGITTLNDAYCWGDNDGTLSGARRIGDGTTTDRTVPALVSGGHKWKSIQSSNRITCGVTTSGVGYCWGTEAVGEMGDGGGTTDQRLIPQAVSGGHVWQYISAGNSVSCGLTVSGAAYCWGSDFYGGVGDGTAGGNETAPKAVTGSHVFSKLDAITMGCGIDDAFDMWCWGQGANGGGAASSTPTPVQIGGNYKWKDIKAAALTVCGLTFANDVFCWGDGSAGQLGNNTTSSYTGTPQKVFYGVKPSAINIGNDSGGMLLSDEENHPAAPCDAGDIVFADLYTPTTSFDLTTETITITNVLQECALHMVSDSPDARLILNGSDLGAGVTQTMVSTGDTLALQIESPSTVGNSYTTTLSIGDRQYTHTTSTERKIAFVTSTTHNGNLGGIAGADAICAARASEAGLSGTFLAWIADSTTYPAARFSHWNYGYYQLGSGGPITADDFVDLTDGTIDDDIDRDEDGNTISAPERTWTGSTDEGLPYGGSTHCNNWTSSSSGNNGRTGNVNNSLNNWASESTETCDDLYRLYCFEQ